MLNRFRDHSHFYKMGFLFLVLLLINTISWAQPAADNLPAKPLLWKVSNKNNSIHILGSLHLLKPSDYPLPTEVTDAFNKSKQIYFEIAPEELNSPELQKAMMQAGSQPPNGHIKNNLSPELWKQLQDYTSKNAIPISFIEKTKPWFASIIISMDSLVKQGMDPKLGLDNHLMAQAKAANKATFGLETLNDQVNVFLQMNDVEQQQLLQEAIEQANLGKEATEALHTAWRQGDIHYLEQEGIIKMQQQYPELYQRINVQRNQAWLKKLDTLLQSNKPTMVVVGALHLVENDGLIYQLKQKGYNVERICKLCN